MPRKTAIFHYPSPRDGKTTMKMRGKSEKEGLTAQNLRFPSPIFDYSALQPPKPQRNEDFEQSVPGYGPQLVVMRWPPHATIVILYACGPILNRDVRHKI